MNIYLVGYRCSGKTTIGKSLASKLSFKFFDTDEIFSQRYGEITGFVEKFGWGSFREKEEEILSEVAKSKDFVCATGGGVIMSYNNRELMKKTGIILWLKVAPDTILQRISADPRSKSSRPALTGLAIDQEVRDTLQKRTPYYESISDHVIEADNLSPEKACKLIMDLLPL